MRASYEESVFLNCPFDPDYQPFLEAVVFTVHDCGFVVRCALEIDDASEVRIARIEDMIAECRLGIHDLSRTELDGDSMLPRFNMPLELGLFLGAKRYGPPRQREKLCLVMDREPYRYVRFCSDLAGQDVHSHAGSPGAAIKLVRNWLSNASQETGVVLPSGSRMEKRFMRFSDDLPLLCDEAHVDRGELIFNDYTTLLAVWQQEHGW